MNRVRALRDDAVDLRVLARITHDRERRRALEPVPIEGAELGGRAEQIQAALAIAAPGGGLGADRSDEAVAASKISLGNRDLPPP